MPADAIGMSGSRVDLSPRVSLTTTVGASPAGASETIIGTLTLTQNVSVVTGVLLEGYAALTIGTSGTACTMRIRQTNVAGTVVGSTGALTAAAATLIAPSINCIDTSPVLPGQVYVLTLTITAGAATSTVSSLSLVATIV